MSSNFLLSCKISLSSCNLETYFQDIYGIPDCTHGVVHGMTIWFLLIGKYLSLVNGRDSEWTLPQHKNPISHTSYSWKRLRKEGGGQAEKGWGTSSTTFYIGKHFEWLCGTLELWITCLGFLEDTKMHTHTPNKQTYVTYTYLSLHVTANLPCGNALNLSEVACWQRRQRLSRCRHFRPASSWNWDTLSLPTSQTSGPRCNHVPVANRLTCFSTPPVLLHCVMKPKQVVQGSSITRQPRKISEGRLECSPHFPSRVKSSIRCSLYQLGSDLCHSM